MTVPVECVDCGRPMARGRVRAPGFVVHVAAGRCRGCYTATRRPKHAPKPAPVSTCTPDPWCTAVWHGTCAAYSRGCRCNAARAVRAEAERARKAARPPRGKGDPTSGRLPIEPLLQLVTDRAFLSNETLARMFYRAQERGYCSVGTADCLAIRILGIHPCFVWGDAWWTKDLEAVA